MQCRWYHLNIISLCYSIKFTAAFLYVLFNLPSIRTVRPDTLSKSCYLASKQYYSNTWKQNVLHGMVHLSWKRMDGFILKTFNDFLWLSITIYYDLCLIIQDLSTPKPPKSPNSRNFRLAKIKCFTVCLLQACGPMLLLRITPWTITPFYQELTNALIPVGDLNSNTVQSVILKKCIYSHCLTTPLIPPSIVGHARR